MVNALADDCSKYKLQDAVTNGVLSDMIEESMHVLWEFLRADKDNTNATSKTPQQAQVAPHDPIDLELLMDVRTELQKACFLNLFLNTNISKFSACFLYHQSHAEGEKAKGNSEEYKLHNKEAPKATSEESIRSYIVHRSS